MFITVEGIEGVGKSTLIRSLKCLFESMGREVAVFREPGGTELAEAVRKLLLDTKSSEPMSDDAELFLFYASRAQNVALNIKPALAAGRVVINDRFFDSSLAYQGFGRGMDIDKILTLNEKFIQLKPDVTLWLDAPVDVGLQRARRRGELDRLEQESYIFFERVRSGFAYLHETQPARVRRINAEQTPEQILNDAWTELSKFEEMQQGQPGK